ncbi:MAG: biotin/lipoyl-binding protein, partial [Longimicrobiales bacterium]
MTTTIAGQGRQPVRKRGTIMAVLVIAGIVLVAAIVRGLGLLGGGGGPAVAAASGPGEMPPMPVDVDTARRESVIDAVRATGRIEAEQAVELRPDEQGRIVALLFDEGQSVAAGTPLVRIDDAMLRAQAERATADRDLARQQLERVRRL